jgi:hypothetical protein
MARKATEAPRPQEQSSSAQVMAASNTASERGNGSAGKPTRNEGFSSDEIAARAYQIYEREGRADGRDMDHWLAAERELRQERSTAVSSGDITEPGEQDRRPSPSRPPQADEAPRSARRHQPSSP